MHYTKHYLIGVLLLVVVSIYFPMMVSASESDRLTNFVRFPLQELFVSHSSDYYSGKSLSFDLPSTMVAISSSYYEAGGYPSFLLSKDYGLPVSSISLATCTTPGQCERLGSMTIIDTSLIREYQLSGIQLSGMQQKDINKLINMMLYNNGDGKVQYEDVSRDKNNKKTLRTKKTTKCVLQQDQDGLYYSDLSEATWSKIGRNRKKIQTIVDSLPINERFDIGNVGNPCKFPKEIGDGRILYIPGSPLITILNRGSTRSLPYPDSLIARDVVLKNLRIQ